jgi:Na+/H+-translocating membrane pyrophosphatase
VGLGSNAVSPGGLFATAFVGLTSTGVVVAIIESYTTAVSLQGAAMTVTVIAAGMWSAYSVGNGIYGVALAAAAMLSMAAIVVAVDSYGPTTDNVGGIAAVSELIDIVVTNAIVLRDLAQHEIEAGADVHTVLTQGGGASTCAPS